MSSGELLVSGGIFLAVILIPFGGYKLYKYCSSEGCGGRDGRGFSFRRVARGWFGGVPGFLRKRVVPRVELDFEGKALVVGETVSLRVMFPLSDLRSLEIVQEDGALPSVQESSQLQGTYDLQALSIEVKKLGRGNLEGITRPVVTVVTEMLPRVGVEDVILASFVVQEAGFYEIWVTYDGEGVVGSPFRVPFNPDKLDPERSSCERVGGVLLGEVGEPLQVFLSPKDKYGNECNFGDVRTELFSLEVEKGGAREERVGHLIFNFAKRVGNGNSASFLLQGEELGRGLEVKTELELFAEGVYSAQISYDKQPLKEGKFEILILLQEEQRALGGYLERDSWLSSKYFEANLVSFGAEEERKVYLYPASKTLTVKGYMLGFIPFRIATFRMLTTTKLEFVKEKDEGKRYLIVIEDRIQPRMVLDLEASAGRMLLAVFSTFLKQRLGGGSDSFGNKQRIFYEELRRVVGVTREVAGVVLVDRRDVVNSTLQETRGWSGKDWCRNHKIKFKEEEGSDDGGLRREWLNLLCKEMFASKVDGLFCSLGNSRLVHPNASRDGRKWTLKHYELAGKVVGKCVFETAVGGYYKQMVNGKFSRSFLAQIVGYGVHHKYLEQDDPELFESKVKYILENDVSSMDLRFTEDEYTQSGQLLKTVDLIDKGNDTVVANKNKAEYLNSLAVYRLSTKVKAEVEAFIKGLSQIVPEDLLVNFDENELEILFCGRSIFSVEDLKQHHVVSGNGPVYERVLPWFWAAAANMTEDEKSKLLQFTTGSSILPHGGFKELLPAFRITVYDTAGKLPLAHTCFSEICLSLHRNFEEFQKALKLAISEGNESFALM